MKKSTALFLACLAFIFGITLHSLIFPEARLFDPFWWYAGFLGCASIGIIVYTMAVEATFRSPWQTKVCRYMFLFLALILLGLFRYGQIIPVVDEHHISFYKGKEITVEGRVDSLPRVREKTVAYVISTMSLRAPTLRSGRGNSISGKLLLTAERLPEYKYGDALTFTCAPTALNEYEQYARKDGVSVSCAFPRQITRVILSGRPKGTPSGKDPMLYGSGFFTEFRMTLYNIRARVHGQLTSLFLEPYGGLLAGILYGDTSGIGQELKQVFRASGLAHITALSGYNITIMSGMLMSALISLWLTRRQALPVALLIIFGFVLATGAEASVVRAAIMGSLVALAQGIGRLQNIRNALVLAGAVMLAIAPRLLRFDLGFGLSFLSTIALVKFSSPLSERKPLRYLPKFLGIREAGAASVAALLITTPLILYKIGTLGPFAVLVNILVVPIVPFAMGIGALAVAADFIFHPFGMLFATAARVLLGYIISIATYFGKFGTLGIRLNAFGAVLLFLSIIGALRFWLNKKTTPPKPRLVPPHPLIFRIKRWYFNFRKAAREHYRQTVPLRLRNWSKWIALTTIVSAILVGQFLLRREPPLRVYFFDVGQGDGLLIRTAEGFDVLIDGGPTERIVEKLGWTLPYFDRTIELMVLTHPHADHLVGLTAVLKRFKVERVLATGVIHTTDEYLAWLEEIKKQKIPMEIAKAPSRIIMTPNAILEILWPQEDFSGERIIERSEADGGLNATSIVAKLTYGKTSFLFTGDAEEGVEEQLVSSQSSVHSSRCKDDTKNCSLITNDLRLRADVLKVGHHGSKTSTSKEFLAAVSPKYAVIQVGRNNRFGHPHFQTLWRLKQAGVEVLRNDQDGDVVFESDGERVRIAN